MLIRHSNPYAFYQLTHYYLVVRSKVFKSEGGGARAKRRQLYNKTNQKSHHVLQIICMRYLNTLCSKLSQTHTTIFLQKAEGIQEDPTASAACCQSKDMLTKSSSDSQVCWQSTYFFLTLFLSTPPVSKTPPPQKKTTTDRYDRP